MKPFLHPALFFGLFFLGLVTVPTVSAQLGVSAGLNFDRLSDIKLNDQDVTYDNSTGWHVEVWFDLPLGALTIRPGVRYMDAGQLFQGLQDAEASVEEDFDIKMVEVPLDIRLRMGNSVVGPYLVGGPVVRFPIDKPVELEDELILSFAGSFGVGVELGLGPIVLYPELIYTFGVSKFIEETFTIGSHTFEADAEQRLNTVMLRLGLGF